MTSSKMYAPLYIGWVICAFRVQNPRQWLLAKTKLFKKLGSDTQKVPKQG